jgi:Predicted metal-binding, possibly nucleic acid-binding protein
VSVEIAEEYLPSVDPESGTPLEAPEEGQGVLTINAHHEIELDAVLHDELLLTEPMHPLCRPGCPGLCVTCGQSLRAAAHDHGESQIDPRLAVLARLLDRPDG